MSANCPYAKNVDCSETSIKRCGKCGWNPDVAEKRIKAWKIERILEASEKR